MQDFSTFLDNLYEYIEALPSSDAEHQLVLSHLMDLTEQKHSLIVKTQPLGLKLLLTLLDGDSIKRNQVIDIVNVLSKAYTSLSAEDITLCIQHNPKHALELLENYAYSIAASKHQVSILHKQLPYEALPEYEHFISHILYNLFIINKISYNTAQMQSLLSAYSSNKERYTLLRCLSEIAIYLHQNKDFKEFAKFPINALLTINPYLSKDLNKAPNLSTSIVSMEKAAFFRNLITLETQTTFSIIHDYQTLFFSLSDKDIKDIVDLGSKTETFDIFTQLALYTHHTKNKPARDILAHLLQQMPKSSLYYLLNTHAYFLKALQLVNLVDDIKAPLTIWTQETIKECFSQFNKQLFLSPPNGLNHFILSNPYHYLPISYVLDYINKCPFNLLYLNALASIHVTPLRTQCYTENHPLYQISILSHKYLRVFNISWKQTALQLNQHIGSASILKLLSRALKTSPKAFFKILPHAHPLHSYLVTTPKDINELQEEKIDEYFIKAQYISFIYAVLIAYLKDTQRSNLFFSEVLAARSFQLLSILSPLFIYLPSITHPDENTKHTIPSLSALCTIAYQHQYPTPLLNLYSAAQKLPKHSSLLYTSLTTEIKKQSLFIRILWPMLLNNDCYLVNQLTTIDHNDLTKIPHQQLLTLFDTLCAAFILKPTTLSLPNTYLDNLLRALSKHKNFHQTKPHLDACVKLQRNQQAKTPSPYIRTATALLTRYSPPPPSIYPKILAILELNFHSPFRSITLDKKAIALLIKYTNLNKITKQLTHYQKPNFKSLILSIPNILVSIKSLITHKIPPEITEHIIYAAFPLLQTHWAYNKHIIRSITLLSNQALYRIKNPLPKTPHNPTDLNILQWSASI